jgi:hypothetical protein
MPFQALACLSFGPTGRIVSAHSQAADPKALGGKDPKAN